MRRVPVTAAAVFSLSLAAYLSTVSAGLAEAARGSQPNPCAAPNEVGPSFEETAWQIWVAATCPVNSDQYPFVVWENWIEQAQLYPANPSQGLKVPNSGAPTATHILHNSPLTIALSPDLAVKVPGLLGAPDAACNKAKAPPPGQPNLIFCEEVRVNGAAEDYIAGANLWNRTGQEQAAANGDDIEFPRPAVEVKVDWTLLNRLGLDCDHLPDEFTTHPVHIEIIHGNCFAMSGMHVMSKLIDKWIWATFEPQNSITNPNRCKELGCYDPFGSKPAKSGGHDTQLSRNWSSSWMPPIWRRNGKTIGWTGCRPTTFHRSSSKTRSSKEKMRPYRPIARPAPPATICLRSRATASMASPCCRPFPPILSGSRSPCRQKPGSGAILPGRCCWLARTQIPISTPALRRQQRGPARSA